MRDEQGSALVLVLLCASLFLVLAGALATVASTEATISATFRDSAAAMAGAEAGVIRVLADLAGAPDLTDVFTGSIVSTFNDGPIAAPRRLPDGTWLDLVAATGMERCGQAACTDDEMNAVTADRPWGANNARWQLYGSGWLRDLAPEPLDAPHVYVAVWVGDDPLDADGNPLIDAPAPDALGHGVALLRATAWAAHSVRRRIEVVARRHGGVARVTSWRELR